MSPFLESILAKITHEAEQASLHAISHKKLIDEAEALQKILVDHSHDGTMQRAIEASGLKVKSETYEPDSTGHGSCARILLEGYACRIWINLPAAPRTGFSPIRWARATDAESA